MPALWTRDDIAPQEPRRLARLEKDLRRGSLAYGVTPNRVMLNAFPVFCAEQGVVRRRVAIEELSVPGIDEALDSLRHGVRQG